MPQTLFPIKEHTLPATLRIRVLLHLVYSLEELQSTYRTYNQELARFRLLAVSSF